MCVAEADAVTGQVGEVLQEGAESWTGWPSSVRSRAALRRAAGETLALATGDERCAAAAAGSSVSAKRIDILLSNHNGVSARR